MSRNRTSRALGTGIALVTAAALVLTGCASDPDSGEANTGDVFPVTVQHAYGESVITEEPQRVATIGWSSGDIVYSFGVTPVAVEADRWAGDEDGYQPWLREAIEADGGELPVLVDVYPEIDIDALIAAEPDLILAPLSGITEDQYDQLSNLATTVAFPEDPWNTPWPDLVTIIGESLGKAGQVDEVISGIEATIADAAAAHPDLANYSFAYIYAGGEPGTLSFYKAGDARNDLITALGLTETPAVADAPVTPGQFVADVGLENADLLDEADIVFTWFNSEDEQATVESQALYAQIPAVQRGSDVVIIDRPLGMASAIVTPLSLPWSIDRFIPMIEAAAANVQR